MKSIRRLVYAAALMLSALNFAPSQASAQDASGSFVLTHEVHCQSAVVPSGTYRFTTRSWGPNEVLMLRKISAHPAGFMLMSAAKVESRAAGRTQLDLVSRGDESFVSTLQLPEAGLTLYFTVPAEPREVEQAVEISTVTSR